MQTNLSEFIEKALSMAAFPCDRIPTILETLKRLWNFGAFLDNNDTENVSGLWLYIYIYIKVALLQ